MKFTIFTGSYNSSKFIDRVFKSLKSQTYQNFEWIVIDDASKDDTVSILTEFKNENPELDIKLIALEKNRSVGVNRRHAIKIAEGDLFVTWDHDDEQLPNQLEIFKNAWKSFGSQSVANIFAFCVDQNNNYRGDKFPKGDHVDNYFTYYKKYFMSNIVKQEKHVCTSIKILKKYIDYEFPEGYKLNGEIMWAKLALEYDSIFINTAVRKYYIEASNSNNMSSATRTQAASNIYKMKSIWVNHFLVKMKHEPLLVLRLYFAKVFYGFLSKKSLFKIIGNTNGIFSKIIILFMSIPARLLLIKMKITKKGL